MKTDFKLSLLVLFSGTLLLAGCEKGPESGEMHYVKLDYAEYSFQASGNQSLTVDIRANPAEWSVESDASWLKYVGEDNSIVITVDDNETVDERIGTITVTAGKAVSDIKIHQLGSDDGLPSRYRMDINYFGGVLSPNGRYFGAYFNGYDDNGKTINYPVIIDVQTDERVVLGPYPASMFGLSDPMAITDQGTLFIDDTAEGGVIGFTLDGDYFRSEAAPGFGGRTVIEGTSLGGDIMVGWGYNSPDGYLYGPVKIENGEYIPLPLPELNYRGEEHDQGIMARGVSANGEIIYGSTWDDWDAGMVYWDKDGNVHYVGEDVRNERKVELYYEGSGVWFTLVDGMQTWAGAGNASPSGKWLAGTFTEETLDSSLSEVQSSYYPAYFNTETGTTVVLEEYPGYGGCGVTDEGIAFMASQGGYGGSGPVINLDNGGTVAYATLAEYIQARYGILVPDGGQLKYLSADGKALLGLSIIAAPYGPDTCCWYVAEKENAGE